LCIFETLSGRSPQIQSAVVDDVSNKMLALYAYEKSKPINGVIDLIYHANSTLLLQDETSYRFEHVRRATPPLSMFKLGVSDLSTGRSDDHTSYKLLPQEKHVAVRFDRTSGGRTNYLC
jgi:hypothetical protein